MDVKIKRYKSGKNSGIIYKNEVKLDPSDTWDTDWTIATITLPLLVQLKLSKHGAPFTDDEDVPEELRSTNVPPKQNEFDTDENHFKRWDWIMDEMIWGMQEIANHCANEPVVFKFTENGANPGTKDFLSSREIPGARDLNKAYLDRLSNSTKLFGKYFRNLWD